MQFQISNNMKSLLKGLFLLVFLASFTSYGQTGTGTLADPYTVTTFPYTYSAHTSSNGETAIGMQGACPALVCCSVNVYKVTLPANGMLRVEMIGFTPLAGSIIAYHSLAATPTAYSDLSYISQTPANFCGFRDTLQLGRAFLDNWRNIPYGGSPTNYSGLTAVYDFNSPSYQAGYFPAGDYYLLVFNENQQVNFGSGNMDLTFEFVEACAPLTVPTSVNFDTLEYNAQSDTVSFYVKNQRTLDIVIDTANISITGTSAADFTLFPLSDTVLTAGDSVLMQAVFTPTGGGIRSASIEIPFADTNCSTSSSFPLEGMGAEAEIIVLGNSVSISHNDLSPSINDFTDMGAIVANTSSITKEYFITNTGLDTLELSGSPKIAITGDAQFSVTSQPLSTVLPGDTTSFIIEFTPTTEALVTTDVSISNNDASQAPFTFRVQATGAGLNGLDFDGSGDYVNINSASTGMTGATAFTLETWIKVDPAQSGNDMILGVNTSSNGSRIFFKIDDGILEFDVGTTSKVISSQDVRDNLWHNMVFIFDNGTLSYYLDGVLASTITNNIPAFVATDKWSIGQEYDSGGASDFLNATIDEFRLWNVARTPAQILDARYCEISDHPANLVAYYQFNQGVADGNNTSISTLTNANATNSAVTGILNGFTLNGTASNFVSATNVGTNCTSQRVAVCDNNSYSFGGNTYTSSGVYIDTLTNGTGGDSIVYTDLALNYSSYAQTIISDTTLCPTDVLTGDTVKTSLVSTLHFEQSNSDWVELDEIADSLINTNRSVFLWMRAAGQVSGSTQVLVGINTSGTSTVTNFGIGTNEQLNIYDGGTTRNSGITVTDGDWHHVGYTYDEASNLTTFYVDGVAGANFSNGQSISATSRISFGQEFDGSTPSNFFDGDMTEISIWNEVLDVSDIAKIMTNAITSTHPKYSNLISYHTGNALCSDNERELKDMSGNNLHGVTSANSIINTDSLVAITGFNASGHFSTSLIHNGSSLSSTNPYSFSYATAGSYVATLSRDFFKISDTFNITNGVACSGVIASITNSSNATCNGLSNGGATVSATSGTTPYTYTWSNSATTASITGVIAGTYTVTVSDANGNTATTSTTITQPATVISSAAVTNAIACNSGTQGQVTASSTGGTTPYTFSWNTGGTATLETGLGAGTYSVTITDQNGCTDSSSVVLSEPVVLNSSASVTNSIACNNGTQGQVTASSTGGTTPYTFSWNTGGTAALETGLGAGTYSVTITDQNGCTDSTSVVLTEPVVLNSSASVTNIINCNNGTQGQVTASSTGGTTPYTFSWNTGGTAALETGLGASTYSVTITDQNGCTDSTSVVVTEPVSLVASSSVTSTINCNGVTNGQVTASAAGGTSPFTYSWNTGGTAALETNLGASTYSVTITDQNGCTDSSSVIITEPVTLIASSSVTSTINCNGVTNGQVTASAAGGTSPFTYSWNTGGTVALETNLGSGTYSVTITDQNGCTDSTSVVLTEPASLIASASVSSAISTYNGTNGQITSSAVGGTTPFTYSWNTGGTAALETGLGSGTYSVTVTDQSGCTDSASVWLNQPPAFAASAIVDSNVSCNGLTNGGASASPIGGSPAYTYAWSNGASSASITGLVAGTYTVTITDGNSLTGTSSVTITQPATLIAGSVVDSNTTCNGFANGGATASATGGSMPYTYSWSNSATTASITGVVAGTYTTTITDVNGCSSTSSVTVTEPVTLVAANVVDSNTTCNGYSNGGATASATGGSMPYTYAWSNAATTASITGVVAGTYTATITDANGCTSTSSATLTEPVMLVAATVVDSNISCNSFSDGGATASATGGTSPYTYAWSNSATTASITGVVAGTYSITIMDANGCTSFSSATVTEPTTLTTASVVDSNVTCNGVSDGGATASAIGGTTPYTYSWSTSTSSATIATTASITGVVAGTYSVTIMDANGCSSTSSATVTEPTILVAASVVDSNTTCNGFANGGATASATGGTMPYTYSWSNSATTASITGVTAGTYSVTIVDANGCSSTSAATVTEPAILAISSVVDSNITCNGLSNGGVTASATSGTAPYTYAWSNSATTASITGVTAGTYSVTIMDANGCSSTSVSTVMEPAILVSASIVDSNITCNGSADGGATASATGGTSPYTYTWSNSATTASITGVVAGTYSVTIMDVNGCTSTSASTVTEPTILVSASVVDSNATCNGFANGGASASATGGTSPYTYAWSNSATTASITGVLAGTYSVTIMDANGCSSISSSTITEPTLLVAASVVDSNITCNGFANGGATASATGGTAPYSYSWNNAATTASITGVMAGTYSVTIMDANGCTSASSTTITEPTILLAVTMVDSTISCNGLSDGGATASATGGTAPYSYSWNNTATTASITGVTAGTYMVTILDANNCSSVATVAISEPNILLGNSHVDSNATCDGLPNGGASALPTGGTAPYSYLWSTSATTSVITGLSAGSYAVTVTDANGCTSVESVIISSNNSTYSFISENACNSYTSPSGLYTWTASGSYQDTIPNMAGCDSIITIMLTINENGSQQNITICKGESITVGSNTYTTTGSFTNVFTNGTGCDSTVITNLTVQQVDVTTTQTGFKLEANNTVASYQWINCDSNNAIIPGATNRVYLVTVSGNYAVIVTDGGCVDTSNCVLVDGLGINDFAENRDINVYPNPIGLNTSVVTIDVSNTSNYDIIIRDLTGKTIYLEEGLNNETNQIDVSRFAAGTFFIEIKTDQFSEFKRLIVM